MSLYSILVVPFIVWQRVGNIVMDNFPNGVESGTTRRFNNEFILEMTVNREEK